MTNLPPQECPHGGVRQTLPAFLLNLLLNLEIERSLMKSTRKEIRGLDESAINVIEKRAQELNITSNQLIKDVINDYAAR